MSAPAAAAAKTIGTAVAPEFAIPAQVVLEALQKRRQDRRRDELPHQVGETVVVQPAEHEPALKFGKDKVRVVVKKGVKIVLVDRAPGLSAGEVVLLVAGAGVTYAGYKAYKTFKQRTAPQKNALGIPFGNVFPGGGSNPMNYLFP